jgi:hypothetical protein
MDTPHGQTALSRSYTHSHQDTQIYSLNIKAIRKWTQHLDTLYKDTQKMDTAH